MLSFYPLLPKKNSYYYEGDLKPCLDYCEDPTRSCENLKFCFLAQTKVNLGYYTILNYLSQTELLY